MVADVVTGLSARSGPPSDFQTPEIVDEVGIGHMKPAQTKPKANEEPTRVDLPPPPRPPPPPPLVPPGYEGADWRYMTADERKMAIAAYLHNRALERQISRVASNVNRVVAQQQAQADREVVKARQDAQAEINRVRSELESVRDNVMDMKEEKARAVREAEQTTKRVEQEEEASKVRLRRDAIFEQERKRNETAAEAEQKRMQAAVDEERSKQNAIADRLKAERQLIIEQTRAARNREEALTKRAEVDRAAARTAEQRGKQEVQALQRTQEARVKTQQRVLNETRADQDRLAQQVRQSEQAGKAAEKVTREREQASEAARKDEERAEEQQRKADERTREQERKGSEQTRKQAAAAAAQRALEAQRRDAEKESMFEQNQKAEAAQKQNVSMERQREEATKTQARAARAQVERLQREADLAEETVKAAGVSRDLDRARTAQEQADKSTGRLRQAEAANELARRREAAEENELKKRVEEADKSKAQRAEAERQAEAARKLREESEKTAEQAQKVADQRASREQAAEQASKAETQAIQRRANASAQYNTLMAAAEPARRQSEVLVDSTDRARSESDRAQTAFEVGQFATPVDRLRAMNTSVQATARYLDTATQALSTIRATIAMFDQLTDLARVINEDQRITAARDGQLALADLEKRAEDHRRRATDLLVVRRDLLNVTAATAEQHLRQVAAEASAKRALEEGEKRGQRTLAQLANDAKRDSDSATASAERARREAETAQQAAVAAAALAQGSRKLEDAATAVNRYKDAADRAKLYEDLARSARTAVDAYAQAVRATGDEDGFNLARAEARRVAGIFTLAQQLHSDMQRDYQAQLGAFTRFNEEVEKQRATEELQKRQASENNAKALANEQRTKAAEDEARQRQERERAAAVEASNKRTARLSVPSPLEFEMGFEEFAQGFRLPQFARAGSLCFASGMFATRNDQRIVNATVTILPSVCRSTARHIVDRHVANTATLQLEVDRSGNVTWRTNIVSPWVSLTSVILPTDDGRRVAIPLATPWAHFGSNVQSPSFVKEGDFCALGGAARLMAGTTWSSNIGVVPEACRPAERLMFGVNHGDTTHRVDLMPDGNLVWVAGERRVDWLSLDGISFFVTMNASNNLQLAPGWQAFGNGFRTPNCARQDNVCSLSGVVRPTQVNGSNLITTVPAGCAPASGTLVFAVNRHNRQERIDILPNGEVRWVEGSVGQEISFLPLDGISYLVAPAQPWEAEVAERVQTARARRATETARVEQLRQQAIDELVRPKTLELNTNNWAPFGHEMRMPQWARHGSLCFVSGTVETNNMERTVGFLPENCRPAVKLAFDGIHNGIPTRFDVDVNGAVQRVAGAIGQTLPLEFAHFAVAESRNLTALPLNQPWRAYGQGFGEQATLAREGDFVLLGGMVAVPRVDNWTELIATLPEGARPEARLRFHVNHNQHSHTVDVLPDGRVLWFAGQRQHTYLALNGISFFVRMAGGNGTVLSLRNGYAAFGEDARVPAARRDNRLCVLSGMVRTTANASSVVGNVPTDCVPATGGLTFFVASSHVSGLERIQIGRDGAISRDPARLRDAGWFSLDGIAYMDGPDQPWEGEAAAAVEASQRRTEQQRREQLDALAVAQRLTLTGRNTLFGRLTRVPQYARFGDICLFSGTVAVSQTGPSVDLATLPAQACRPFGGALFAVPGDNGNLPTRLLLTSLKVAGLWQAEMADTFVSLDGLTFPRNTVQMTRLTPTRSVWTRPSMEMMDTGFFKQNDFCVLQGVVTGDTINETLRVRYNFTGSVQNYTVLPGTTSLTIKLWGGAGGAGRFSDGAVFTSGGGGFTTVTLTSAALLRPGNVISVTVGGGGRVSGVNQADGAGGWPNGGLGVGSDARAGGGGGRSQIAVNGVVIAVAGGGGGSTGIGAHAGAGGGASGAASSSGTAGGGSQTSGGEHSDLSLRGGLFFGGAGGGNSSSGGGGGDGFYGGAGGGFSSRPGGGGSGFVNLSLAGVSGSTFAGDGPVPGGVQDPDFPGTPFAFGREPVGVAGGDGVVVLIAQRTRGAGFQRNSVITTLPETCRPRDGALTFASTNDRVVVFPDGRVVADLEDEETTVSLSAISFFTEMSNPLQLMNNWTAAGNGSRAPSWRKDGMLCGLGGAVSSTSNSTRIATAPTDCTPTSGHLSFLVSSSLGMQRVDVMLDGAIVWRTSNPAPVTLFLDSIHFLVGPVPEWEAEIKRREEERIRAQTREQEEKLQARAAEAAQKADAEKALREAEQKAADREAELRRQEQASKSEEAAKNRFRIPLATGMVTFGQGYLVPQWFRFGDVCILMGVMQGANVESRTLATLPAECRPRGRVAFAQNAANLRSFRLDIDREGRVFMGRSQSAGFADSNVWIPFDGIIMPVSGTTPLIDLSVSSQWARVDANPSFTEATYLKAGDLCVMQGALQRVSSSGSSLVASLGPDCRPAESRNLFFLTSRDTCEATIELRIAGNGAQLHFVRETCNPGNVFPGVSLAGIAFFTSMESPVHFTSTSWGVFNNGYRAPMFKVQDNVCMLSGVASRGSSSGLIQFAELPAACRPTRSATFSVTTNGDRMTARVDVRPDGRVVYADGPQGATWVSLDGVRFATNMTELKETHVVINKTNVVRSEAVRLLSPWVASNQDARAGLYRAPLRQRLGGLCLLSGVAYSSNIRLQLSGAAPDWCVPSANRTRIFDQHIALVDTVRLDVQANGAVQWMAGADTGSWMPLDGIIFPVEGTMSVKLFPTSNYVDLGGEFAPVSYYVEMGLCLLQGVVRTRNWSVMMANSGSHILQLPPECSPRDGRVVLRMGHSQFTQRADVTSEGALHWQAGTVAHPWVSLDGMIFYTQSPTALTLLPGWVWHSTTFRRPSYRIFRNNMCVLSGVLTNQASNRDIVVLPLECRPRDRLVFAINQNERCGRLDVLPDGRVLYIDGPLISWVSLDGVYFIADAPAPRASPIVSWKEATTTRVPMNSGWRDFGEGFAPATFTRAGPMCYLSGRVASSNLQTAIATLPEACRPAGNHVFIVAGHSLVLASRVDVEANGLLTWKAGNFEENWLPLDGISFPVRGTTMGQITLQDMWVQFGYGVADPSYLRVADLCVVSGVIRTDNFNVNQLSNTLVSLPADCRPRDGRLIFAAASEASPQRLDVSHDGTISRQAGVISQPFISLSGIQFMIESASSPLSFSSTTYESFNNNFRIPSYKKEGNMCYLSGLITHNGNSNAEITVLPEECRPTARLFFSVNQNDQLTRLSVNAAGQLTFLGPRRTNWIPLDGVRIVSESFAKDRVDAPAVQSRDGTALQLRNGFSAYGRGFRNPLFTVVNDLCVLAGRAIAPSLQAVMATLPADCRPRFRQVWSRANGAGTNNGFLFRLDVGSNGDVQWIGAPPQFDQASSGNWISLDGIIFPLQDRALTTLPPINNWINVASHDGFGGLAYYVRGDQVIFTGVVQHSNLIQSHKGQLASLPSDIRPVSGGLIFATAVGSNMAQVQVNRDGNLNVATLTGSGNDVGGAFLSVDGVAYYRTDGTQLSLRSNYGNHGSWRRPMVHIEGRLCTLSGMAVGSTRGVVAVLPSRCWPRERLVFHTNNHLTYLRIDVLPDGRVFMPWQNNHGWIVFDGIRYVVSEREEAPVSPVIPDVPEATSLTNIQLAGGLVAVGDGSAPPQFWRHGVLCAWQGTATVQNAASLRGVIARLPASCVPSATLQLQLFTDSSINRDRSTVRFDLTPAGELRYVSGDVVGSMLSFGGIVYAVSSAPSAPIELQSVLTSYMHGFAAPSYTVVGRLCVLSGTAGVDSGLANDFPSSLIAILPTDCRPERALIFSGSSNDRNLRFNIEANGQIVMIERGSTPSGIVSFANVAFMVANTQTTDTALQLSSPWSPYGGSYRTPSMVLQGDMCALSGLTSSNGANAQSTITVLPVTCRPATRLTFVVNNHNRVLRVNVLPNGQVVLMTTLAHAFVPLDGIRFRRVTESL